jgi:hypothetical protein
MPRNLTENAIRRKLHDYLNGKMSLREFRQWFVPETWDIEEWAPKDLQEFIYSIKLLFAEYTSGHRTKSDLQEQLRSLVTTYSIRWEELVSSPQPTDFQPPGRASHKRYALASS